MTDETGLKTAATPEVDAQEALRRIRAEAETASNELRWVRTCTSGDQIRQGDVFLYPVDRPRRHGACFAHLRLAGESAGSRHSIEGNACTYQRVDADDDPLAGPWLHARERVTLTHPEHAHVSVPAGWYEVRFQRDFDAAAAPLDLARAIREKDEAAYEAMKRERARALINRRRRCRELKRKLREAERELRRRAPPPERGVDILLPRKILYRPQPQPRFDPIWLHED